ncbi:hypothetical protein MCGE09_00296 [Thaumarchaeota archaeon SCGC AB-539-E09]|nr:hypothetical protein MCGE09_00296 [Thaumarchaeota archaeon SCGC AB-539-E09]
MKSYDPLFNLYQIESDETNPIDKEIVGLMADILYNVEDMESIDRDISILINNSQVSNEKYFSLIKTMIESLDVELSLLSLMQLTPI